MQKFKKPVSIILSILMVVSMFVVVPFTASAAGEVAEVNGTQYATLAAAIADAQAGDTVKLVANVTEAVSITGKTLTLDLNGFNITSPSSTQPIKAYGGTKLTIVNTNTDKAENTPTQNAVLGSTGGANNYGSLFASGEGTEVIINAGYYYGYNGDKTAIHAVNKATVTFNDCVVNGAAGFDGTGTTGKEGKIFYSGVGNPTQPYAMDPGYIVVHGGTFSGRMSDSNWGNYLIDGGTFDRNAVVINENPVDANGNRVATASGNMTKIKDGTFYDSNWLAPGFAPVANGDGTFTVNGPYAAAIGTTGYATLAAAINAAQTGDTVKLLASVEETLTISNKTLTIDLNGFNITSKTQKQPITADNGTKLTIVNTNEDKAENTPTQNAIMGPSGGNNYGSLIAKGENTTVEINAGYYYGYNGNKTAIHALNGATITINDCVVNGAQGIDDTTTGKEGKVFYSGVSNPTQPYATSPGTIIVHGGTFAGRMSDSNWGNYVIDGGTFDRNSVILNENPVDENGNRVQTASGSMTTLPNSPGTLEEAGWLAPGYKVVDKGNSTYGVTPKTYVAQVGDDKYETFAEAVAAANGTETISLLANAGSYTMTDGQVIKVIKNSKSLTLNAPEGAYAVEQTAYNSTTKEYTYTAVEAVAKAEKNDTTTYYASAYDALRNAATGSTITLLKDSTESAVTVGTKLSGKNYTIDLNDKTLTLNGSGNALFNIASPSHLTIQNGTIVFDGTGNNQNGILLGDVYNSAELTLADDLVIEAKGTCSAVTVAGGTLTTEATMTSVNSPTLDTVNNAMYSGYTANVTGGSITCTNEPAIRQLGASGTMNISGGTITGDTNALNVTAGTVAVSGGTFSSPVAAEYCAENYKPVDNGNGTYGVTPKVYVAQVGDDKFEDFAEAVAASHADNEAVITPLVNLNELAQPVYTMSVGEVLNVKYVSGYNAYPAVPEGYHVNVATVTSGSDYVFHCTVEENVVKIARTTLNTATGDYYDYYTQLQSGKAGTQIVCKDFTQTSQLSFGKAYPIVNGAIDLGGHTVTFAQSANKSILVRYNANFTVENGTIKFTTGEGFSLVSGNLTVKDDAVLEATGSYSPIFAVQSSTVNVEGTVKSANSWAIATNGSDGEGGYTINIEDGAVVTATNAPAIYHANDGTLNIKGGTITGTTGVYVKSGETNITGGTIAATGAKADYTYNGNGTNATGDAIVVDSCGYPGGAPTVTISGNPTITSTNGKQIGDYSYGDNALGEVTATSNTMTLPTGLMWVETDTPGVYEVGQKLFVGHNLLLGGDIGVNFYLNPAVLDAYTGTKTVKFTVDGEETTVEVPSTATDYGYKVTLNVVAARMAHKINAVVYVDDTALDQTDSYSVQDYAEAVYAEPAKYTTADKADALQTLAKAMLNYGSEAQTVFAGDLNEIPDHRADKTVGTTDYTNVTASVVTAKINGKASNLNEVAEQLNAKYYTSSLFYLQNNTLRLYFTPKTYPSAMPNASAYDGNLSNYYYYKDKAPIAAAELDNQQTFSVNGVEFKYSALDYVVAVLNSSMTGAQKNLAKSLFLYNQAANAYFD